MLSHYDGRGGRRSCRKADLGWSTAVGRAETAWYNYDREIVINVRNVLCTNSIVVMKNELRIHIYYHQDTHLETLLETLLEASSVDEGAFLTMADDLLSNSPKLSMVLEPSDMLFEDSLAAFGVVSFWWFVSLGTWQPELVDSFFSL